jgi:hypothetical protein
VRALPSSQGSALQTASTSVQAQNLVFQQAARAGARKSAGLELGALVLAAPLHHADATGRALTARRVVARTVGCPALLPCHGRRGRISPRALRSTRPGDGRQLNDDAETLKRRRPDPLSMQAPAAAAQVDWSLEWSLQSSLL